MYIEFMYILRNLCLGLYKDWLNHDLWENFSTKCQYLPREEEMTNCILDGN